MPVVGHYWSCRWFNIFNHFLSSFIIVIDELTSPKNLYEVLREDVRKCFHALRIPMLFIYSCMDLFSNASSLMNPKRWWRGFNIFACYYSEASKAPVCLTFFSPAVIGKRKRSQILGNFIWILPRLSPHTTFFVKSYVSVPDGRASTRFLKQYKEYDMGKDVILLRQNKSERTTMW